MCKWMLLILCALLSFVQVARAQNWNATHIANVITDPYVLAEWSEATERAFDAPAMESAYPYGPQSCKPMGWQLDPSESGQSGHVFTRAMTAFSDCNIRVQYWIWGVAQYTVRTCDNTTIWTYNSSYGWYCYSGYYMEMLGDVASNGRCACEQGRAATAHPIEIGTGNMSESATDFVSGEGRLRFERYYNSNPLNPDNGNYGWQNAYAMRHIYPMGRAIKSPLPSVTSYPANISSAYTSASSACTQGVSDIAQGINTAVANPAYAGVTGTYLGNGQCQLSNGTVISVLYTDSALAYSSTITDGSAGFVVFRPDGQYVYFTCSNGTCSSIGQSEISLAATSAGFMLTAENGDVESYDLNGNLQQIVSRDGYAQTVSSTTNTADNVTTINTVTDSYGRVLAFAYNTNGLLSQLTLPDQSVVSYGYDSQGRLISVTYPDQSVVQYEYTNVNFPQALTAWIDESDATFATWTYDNTTGMATGSALAGNVDTSALVYGTNSTTLTDNLGTARTYTYQEVDGGLRLTSISGPVCHDCTGQSMTYNANGFLTSAVDWNGNTTDYSYSTTGLLQQRVDAFGTSSQRTSNVNWNSTLRVPLTRTVSNASGTVVSSTQWVYNSNGQTLARCDIDLANSAASGYSCSATGTVPFGVRRTTYTYCTAVGTGCPLTGLLLTATGPRTDVTQTTSYSYYASSSATSCGTPGAACYMSGDLYQVTDPLGHVTTIASYDADGRPTRITDANGINTDLTYTPRGWLTSRTVGGAATTFTYTPYGAVQTITDPDGVTTTYGYDTAHRLIKITDALGNSIQYTLDPAGDKTAEQVYDASGTLHKQLTRTFNTLGQLTTVVDGLNHTVFNASTSGSYDANGNLIQSSDGLGIQRQLGYDALNRLVQTIDNYNGTN